MIAVFSIDRNHFVRTPADVEAGLNGANGRSPLEECGGGTGRLELMGTGPVIDDSKSGDRPRFSPSEGDRPRG